MIVEPPVGGRMTDAPGDPRCSLPSSPSRIWWAVVVVVVVMREFLRLALLTHATQHSRERWRGLPAQRKWGFRRCFAVSLCHNPPAKISVVWLVAIAGVLYVQRWERGSRSVPFFFDEPACFHHRCGLRAMEPSGCLPACVSVQHELTNTRPSQPPFPLFFFHWRSRGPRSGGGGIMYVGMYVCRYVRMYVPRKQLVDPENA